VEKYFFAFQVINSNIVIVMHIDTSQVLTASTKRN
jgi:hypothetical protein